MDYSYRRLTWPDRVAFEGLLEMFADAFGEPETYLGAVPSGAYIEQLLQQDTFIGLVATVEDEVIGGLAAYELQKFEQQRSEIYIYDLAVKEQHRRNGVATRLIEELKPIARARGAWVIFVQADQGDTPAMKLYESLGTRETVYHFDIPV
jgi:aminoglycoside 3-N-acetyltransferase I